MSDYRSQCCSKGCDCSCCYGYDDDCHCVADPCNCGGSRAQHGQKPLPTGDDAMTETQHRFTDFGPDELRWLADVVEEFEQLYITTSRMADHDTIPPTWPVAVPFAGLPVRVVCGENCWVLRVGGDDD